MIGIINRGPVGAAKPDGQHRYEMWINKSLICTFKHVRRRGLAECLRRAATAAEKAQGRRGRDMVEAVIALCGDERPQ